MVTGMEGATMRMRHPRPPEAERGAALQGSASGVAAERRPRAMLRAAAPPAGRAASLQAELRAPRRCRQRCEREPFRLPRWF